MSKRYFSADEIADIKNARGCMVPWPKLAAHFGVSVEDLQVAVGEPAWKAEPAMAAAEGKFDLWSLDRLDGVL